MKYKCCNCGRYFDEDEALIEHSSYESYYDAPLYTHTPLEIIRCPFCHDDELEEIEEEGENEDEI
jgi:hypothetical protein